MHEQRIVELLTRKIAGEATPEELGELLYLLTKYPDAVYYEALLEQVWDLGKNEEKANLDSAYNKHKLNYEEELDFEADKKIRPAYFKRPAFILTVFACALLVISTHFISNYIPVNKEERMEVIAGRGVRKEIKLPDGTIVQLNSDSRISYDMEMQKRNRRDVKLIGEAFFKVAHDKSRPFIVRTNKVAIKVLGTEFNIRDYPGDKESETTLMKGSIELTVNGRSDQKFVLKPSEKLALLKKEDKMASHVINSVLMIENITPVKVGNEEYIEEISWTENKFVFQNESFEDLQPKLERWYNVRIVLEDPRIRSYRFTGIFIKENIIQALEAMQLIKPFNYKLTENEVKIY
jgi:ferric-dicitrate binding protein FerR (iron transport regulator)